jgi:tetratricopeptide (TPR) repeat protein
MGLESLGDCLWVKNKLASAARISQMAYDLAEAAGDEESATTLILSQMDGAYTNGQFEKAEAYFTSFRQREQPDFALYQPGRAEYFFARSQFFQGKLKAELLDHADRVSVGARNLSGQEGLAFLRAEWELTRGNPTPALEAIEQALAITHRTGVPAPTYLCLRALALVRLGRTSEAHEILVDAEEIWTGRTPFFPLFAAETWLALGDRDQAREFVRRAYPLAWADGPPHIHWYYLKRCRELMAELAEPEPELPPFDPANVEPIPYEAEIRTLIEKLKAKAAKRRPKA